MAADPNSFYTGAMQIENAPTLTIDHPDAGAAQSVVASGVWQVHALCQKRGTLKAINKTLASLKGKGFEWDLSGVSSLDHIGAQMFWNAWGKQRPAQLKLDPKQEELFTRIEEAGVNFCFSKSAMNLSKSSIVTLPLAPLGHRGALLPGD